MITGVGFTGKMMSGKDTSANFLTKWMLLWKGPNFIINRMAFADSLKDFCMRYLGLTKHQCYDQEGKKEYNEFWGMTNREILQRVGTEAMRNGFHKDVWAKITELKIEKAVNNGEFFIITDVRFPNEAEIIRKHGGIVVEIIRPASDVSGIEGHASEQRLPIDLIDIQYINDSSLEVLEYKIIVELRDKIKKSWRQNTNTYTDTVAG